MFEAEVEADFELTLHAQSVPLAPSEAEECRRAKPGFQDQCFIVWVKNTNAGPGHEDKPGDFDRHFEVLYELLENPAIYAVPHLLAVPAPASPSLHRDPPGSRCIYGMMTR